MSKAFLNVQNIISKQKKIFENFKTLEYSQKFYNIFDFTKDYKFR